MGFNLAFKVLISVYVCVSPAYLAFISLGFVSPCIILYLMHLVG